MSTIVKRKNQENTFAILGIREIFESIRQGQYHMSTSDVSFRLAADYRKYQGETLLRSYCGFVVLRIGNLRGQEEVEHVMLQVSALPHTRLAWRDSDQRTVYVVGKTEWNDADAPTTEEEMQRCHASAYKMLHYTYSLQLMMSIDTCKPTLDQEVPYSYDPKVYFCATSSPVFVSTVEPRANTHEVAAPDSAFPCLPGMSSLDSMSYVYHSCCSKALEESRRCCHDEEVRREKAMVLLADYCHKAGLPMAYALQRASWMEGWGQRRLLQERIFLNAYEEKINRHVPFGSISRSALLTLQTEGFLALNYELRKNVLTGIVQYRERTGYEFDFMDLTEEAMNSMTIRALKAGLGSWDKDIRRLINSNDIHRYDPLEDFLGSLPAWDGKDRVQELAARVPTAMSDFDYHLHVWLLSMVAHWQGKDSLHGNAIVPLLIGGQGCGKTTFASILLPPELRAYYNDKVDFRSEGDIMSALSRFALINIDEFDSLKKSQQPVLKYLLSKSEVKVRPVYGKVIEHRRRYASFIATTNLSRPLTDPTGSRRFVCVEVIPGAHIDTETPIDYPQLYAQLTTEIQQGKRYWFNEDETQRIMRHNLPFQRIDAITDMVDRLYKVPQTESEGEWMTLDEMLHHMQQNYPYLSISQNVHRDLGVLLREKGFFVHKTKNCNKYLVQRCVL